MRPPTNRGNVTGKRALEIHDKRLRALEMRRAGHDYRSIAAALEYKDPGAAYKAVTAALKATLQEPADEVRRLELERVDKLTLALWPLAELGDFDALDRVLKLMKRRADLLGLDAPKKVEDVTPPVEEVEERVVTTRTQAEASLSAMEEADRLP